MMKDSLSIKKVQSGDRQAFEELLKHHMDGLRGYITLRCRDPEMVDEIAHDTFVFAWQHIDDFSGGSFIAWLKAIASNLLRKHTLITARQFKNKAKYSIHYSHQRAEIFQAEEEGPDETTIWELNTLQTCMEGLSDRMKSIIDLKYRLAHSAIEISEKTQQSVAWVNTTLFRLRKQLKKCMQKAGGV